MASQGPNSPGTCADDATVGTVAWTDPDNAKVSDGVYATAQESFSNIITHYLKATNFGFSIPTGATINGILVEVQKRGPESDDVSWIVDSSIKIVKSDGSIGTTNKADTSTHWPIDNTYLSYGSSLDLWGESWTPTDINNSNFGVVISASLIVDHTITAQIDHIRITIYYTEAPSQTTQTITGKSRIQITTSKTITGLSRIQISTPKTILGKSRITIKTSNTVQGLSRITSTTLKTITGISNILAASRQFIYGLSRITISSSQTILGKSRIFSQTNKTIQGRSAIVNQNAWIPKIDISDINYINPPIQSTTYTKQSTVSSSYTSGTINSTDWT